jgi:hypothetical protein
MSFMMHQALYLIYCLYVQIDVYVQALVWLRLLSAYIYVWFTCIVLIALVYILSACTCAQAIARAIIKDPAILLLGI